jgi:hypothetical protein
VTFPLGLGFYDGIFCVDQSQALKSARTGGFLLVDCPIVDFRPTRQSTTKQSVSDNSTVYISRVARNFTRRISIDKLKIKIELHGADSRHP